MSALRTSAAILVALALSACAEVTWTNPTLTDEQARIKFFECKQNGRQLLAYGSQNLMLAIDATTECLRAHGFTRSAS